MLANGIREETATTGTGTLTLTSITGFPRFSEAFTVGQMVPYELLNSDGHFLEEGYGTVAASNTLERTIILATYASSTYDVTAPTAISLSGTTTVIVGAAASTQMSGISAPDSAAGFRGFSSPHLSYVTPGNFKSATGNTAYYSSFLLDQAIKLAALAAYVNTGVSSNLRLGLWQWKPNGAVGLKLAETADISTSSAGFVSGSVTERLLTPGWYLTALAPKTTSVTVTAYNAGNNSSPKGACPLGLSTAGAGYSFARTALGSFTDLPTTPVITSKTGISSEYAPVVFVVPV